MLATQVQYWDLVERGRHNRATEEQARYELAENQRHNIVSENTNWFLAQETARHNKAGEDELSRHNRAQESLGFATLSESTRHNKVQETIATSQFAESKRHNLRSENLQHYSNQTSRLAQQSKSDQERTQARLNEQKKKESTSKTVKNYVDSAATVSSEVRGWFRTK